jgi:hypothetical protein
MKLNIEHVASHCTHVDSGTLALLLCAGCTMSTMWRVCLLCFVTVLVLAANNVCTLGYDCTKLLACGIRQGWTSTLNY